MSRREYLTYAVACGSACAVLLTASEQQPNPTEKSSTGPARNFALDRADSTAFAQYKGSTFRVCPADGVPTKVELVRVKVEKNQRGAAPRGAFSLIFRGPKARGLAQATHRVEHAELGTFELFLVPVGLPKRRAVYEAVIA
jgi:hypothetical protein